MVNMSSTFQPVTADQLARLPAGPSRYELIQGELRETAPAGPLHGRLAMQIGSSLYEHARSQQLGMVFAAETGFQLAHHPDTVRAPVVAFVRQARIDAAEQLARSTDTFWQGAPDLAVEVISPSDRYTDVEAKVLEWLDAGCRMVIVANPRQRVVTVYRSRAKIAILSASDTIDGDDVVPRWRLPVAELFAD